MLRSFKLGSAFGIPLYVHSTFFLLPLWVLLWGGHESPGSILFGQVMLISLFGCVLLHELGHALMARFYGIPTRDITLYPIGGVARLESTGHRPGQEVCIALAGPAVNLAIVLLLSPLVLLAFFTGVLGLENDNAGLLSLLATYAGVLAVSNGILLLFNLLPVFPMDGGRVLRALLGMGMSHLRATEIAATLGLFAAGGLALLGLVYNPALVMVAIFVAFAGQQELAALRRSEAARLMEELPMAEPVVHPHLNGFTGFLWDRDHRAWVQWIDGRPVSDC